MSFVLAALVLSSLSPASAVSGSVLGQQIQIIKGGKKAGTRAPRTVPVVVESPALTTGDQTTQAKSAELDAKNQDLAQREQAVQEKEAASADAAAKNAEHQKALQKRVEKLGQQNHDAWQNAANGLAGDE